MTIQPTVYEQYLLELINWARANPAAQAAKLGITLNRWRRARFRTRPSSRSSSTPN
jgi:hypothetical protein